jgi:radical SAM superfamily enzyme YgiQ (UPF0313 family)
LFLDDLHAGRPQKLYTTTEYADITKTPVPDFHLLSVKDYAFMNIQVSRGCPFACDFCEITSLLGHKVRMKDTAQIINELDVLYHKIHWRGPVSIVDDNFIGNKSVIKENLLPAMKEWMQAHNFPFSFCTQTSINISDDPELMSLMVETGLNSTFIGIETPEEQTLHDCNKLQNNNRNLLQSVKKIQKSGMQVSGGFIVGFDNDSPGVFQRQIDFIQQSGIVSAMVGLLNAPKNTKLYKQMEAEKRLTVEATGNNTDASMNFTPKMDYQELQEGYQKIIHNIYAVKPYYKRVRRFLLNYKRSPVTQNRINFSLLKAFFKTAIIIGLLKKGRTEYWKLLLWTFIRRPGSIVDAITFAVYGYHFRIIYNIKNRAS